jgi:hypothetical protein
MVGVIVGVIVLFIVLFIVLLGGLLTVLTVQVSSSESNLLLIPFIPLIPSLEKGLCKELRWVGENKLFLRIVGALVRRLVDQILKISPVLVLFGTLVRFVNNFVLSLCVSTI